MTAQNVEIKWFGRDAMKYIVKMDILMTNTWLFPTRLVMFAANAMEQVLMNGVKNVGMEFRENEVIFTFPDYKFTLHVNPDGTAFLKVDGYEDRPINNVDDIESEFYRFIPKSY